MRKVLIALLLTAVAFAQAPTSGGQPRANPNSPQDPNAQKAHQLIEQCIQALGGDAWLNVQDMEQEGRSYAYQHGEPASIGVQFWRFWKFPDKDRVELTKQRDVVYIYNGDKGYEVTYKGTAAMDPVDLKTYLRNREHSLETVLRIWLKQPQTALFYDGPALAQQKYTDRVTVMNSDNDSVTLFLDRDTHLPVKKEYEWRSPDRYRNVEDEVYDNWRAEQGIPTAHSTLRIHNGETTNQRFIVSVKYNQGIPDSKFEAKVTYTPQRPDHPE
jgi:hypothetical protein